MAKLRSRDIQKVIQLFDNELLMIPRLSKVDRMKMRKKIINVINVPGIIYSQGISPPNKHALYPSITATIGLSE